MNEKITVAITDDHKLMRQNISRFLNDMGFDVLIEATNANELLEQLKDSNLLPQVCLLDYNMPGMKGHEVASVLSEQYPSLKLAAFTSESSPSCLIDMIGNGCGTYFIKNSRPEEWRQGIIELNNKGYHYTEWMQKELLAFVKNNYNKLR